MILSDWSAVSAINLQIREIWFLLASSLEMLPFIRQILKDFEAPVLKQIYEDMDPLEDVTDLIKRAIVEEPPLAQKDGGIIREGFTCGC